MCCGALARAEHTPAGERSPAFTPPLRFGAYGSSATVYVVADARTEWRASLTGGESWLSITTGASGVGDGLVQLTAARSVENARQARLCVRDLCNEKILLKCDAIQAAATPLAELNSSVLQVPFPTVPTAMELGIAGKYIAQQIQKIPEPFDLIALAIVLLLVELVAQLAVALRGALSEAVPEPLTWFGAPEPYAAMTLALPATAVFIEEETALLDIYIPLQVASGGE